ncbi:MAG: glucose 1-dehydrogenase [Pseudomonadales bacterium]|nr:glucose 1-dehydrogenase [Pseudomonadales bacterium]
MKDKIVLITGGARGLGAATAKKMAAAGAKVLITDLLQAESEATVASITKAGGEAFFLEHDVTDEARWAEVVEAIEARYGGLDVLVNNAGIASDGTPLATMTLESWRRVISVDLDSVFLGIKYAIPAMKKRLGVWQGGGSIVNISSIYGIVGSPGAAAYHAAKGGVRLLTKGAALELAPDKIRVNSVHPGFIETNMVKEGIRKMAALVPDISENEMMHEVAQRHPIGRMGLDTDIANAVFYLASEESSFMTGSEMVVDGGFTAQ